MSRKRKIRKPRQHNRNATILEGRLVKNKRGFGFVCPEDGDDIFVSGRDMNGAMNGDFVRVKAHENFIKRGAFEGKIIKIIERSCQVVVGHLIMERGLLLIEPISSNDDAISISKKNIGAAQIGDVVQAKIIKYPKAGYMAEGKVKSIVAEAGDEDEFVLSHIADYGINPYFSDKVINEAEAVANGVKIAPTSYRQDYRSIKTITIDGADSSDFDDAISVSKLENGNFMLLVHIADVAEYVREGTILDMEALSRGNSVYLPDRVIPMLPERLSNGECSLNPGVNRLTLTASMEIDEDGHVTSYDIDESIIRSDYRLIYDDISDILEYRDSALVERYSDIYPMLLDALELFKVLNKRRKRDGSIDFDLPESKIILDEDGKPTDIKLYERRVANRMIEEFMLVANKTVAEHYFWAKVPFVYRVHQKPDALKMQELRSFLSGLGITINGKSDSIKTKELSNVLRAIAGKSEEPLVSRVMIRTMQKANYSTACLGHYGLAFKYYCHFTSPIRRYADLLVHRAIKDQIHKGKYIGVKGHYMNALDDVCKHISETERNSMELERKITKYYHIIYMQGHLGEEFDGIVSGVRAHGIYVELPNTVEGFVSFDSLDEYYIVDEKTYTAVGEVSGKTITLGQPVRIKVSEVVPEDGYIDFDII